MWTETEFHRQKSQPAVTLPPPTHVSEETHNRGHMYLPSSSRWDLATLCKYVSPEKFISCQLGAEAAGRWSNFTAVNCTNYSGRPIRLWSLTRGGQIVRPVAIRRALIPVPLSPNHILYYMMRLMDNTRVCIHKDVKFIILFTIANLSLSGFRNKLVW